MIYTVTANPSLDYIMDIPGFNTGMVNRTSCETMKAGGKGINVSIVLHNLGIENTALGFTAGFTGAEIEQQLCRRNIHTDFIRLEQGFSRINTKLRSTSGTHITQETDINGQGPVITQAHVLLLHEKLALLKEGDILVLAGSIPSSLPQTFYRDIMSRYMNKGILFVIDATQRLLQETLCHRPFLVKPNHHELGDIFGKTFSSQEEVIPYAKRLQELGAQNVLVSMAEKGAVLAAADGAVYRGPVPSAGPLVNSVGAGDSMVAGFLAGWQETRRYADALRTGVCAGTASATSSELATKDRVFSLYNEYSLF